MKQSLSQIRFQTSSNGQSHQPSKILDTDTDFIKSFDHRNEKFVDTASNQQAQVGAPLKVEKAKYFENALKMRRKTIIKFIVPKIPGILTRLENRFLP